MLSRQDILSSKVPLIFKNILDWNISEWSIEDWKMNLGETNVKYPFREGFYSCATKPVWETKCKTKSMTMSEFFDRFSNSSRQDNWLYFDYKHISDWFSNTLKDISWTCMGFPERSGKDSTIWMGTKGAHTPCHMDTYGCNLVAQLYGKKIWLLFDQSETNKLQPTRVPYEESSIYSNINFSCTCQNFPDIKEVRCVILEPGDVLYVPNHWWHYVENVSSAISINTWIPVESDDESRIDESLVKCFISSVVQTLDTPDVDGILNPNERDLKEFTTSHNINELNWCIEKVKKHKTTVNKTEDTPAKSLTNYTLPIRTLHDIIESVKEKCMVPVKIETPDNHMISVENLINAFCHPNVIANVRSTLFDEFICKS